MAATGVSNAASKCEAPRQQADKGQDGDGAHAGMPCVTQVFSAGQACGAILGLRPSPRMGPDRAGPLRERRGRARRRARAPGEPRISASYEPCAAVGHATRPVTAGGIRAEARRPGGWPCWPASEQGSAQSRAAVGRERSELALDGVRAVATQDGRSRRQGGVAGVAGGDPRTRAKPAHRGGGGAQSYLETNTSAKEAAGMTRSIQCSRVSMSACAIRERTSWGSSPKR